MEQLYKEAKQVRKAIRVYGGSFMQALGNAMDYADFNNLGKIRSTWDEDWERYLKMAEMMDNRNTEVLNE